MRTPHHMPDDSLDVAHVRALCRDDPRRTGWRGHGSGWVERARRVVQHGDPQLLGILCPHIADVRLLTAATASACRLPTTGTRSAEPWNPLWHDVCHHLLGGGFGAADSVWLGAFVYYLRVRPRLGGPRGIDHLRRACPPRALALALDPGQWEPHTLSPHVPRYWTRAVWILLHAVDPSVDPDTRTRAEAWLSQRPLDRHLLASDRRLQEWLPPPPPPAPSSPSTHDNDILGSHSLRFFEDDDEA